MRSTVKEAAAILGVTTQYIKYLIRNKVLDSTLEPLHEGALTKRHMITDESLNAYKNRLSTRSRREDSRNKFIFYATPDEYWKVVDAVRKTGLGEVADTMLPANTNKAMRFLYAPDGHSSGRFVQDEDGNPAS